MTQYPTETQESVHFTLDDLIAIQFKAKVYTAKLFHPEKGWCKAVAKAIVYEGNQEAIEHEIRLWKRLNHPNIVRLLYSYDYQGSMFLFMEQGTPLGLYVLLNYFTV